jgi:hypothetical protein
MDIKHHFSAGAYWCRWLYFRRADPGRMESLYLVADAMELLGDQLSLSLLRAGKRQAET